MRTNMRLDMTTNFLRKQLNTGLICRVLSYILLKKIISNKAVLLWTSIQRR